MTGKITLEVPASLAEDLADASQDFLVELLERGLRQSRIERALERYKQGGVSFAAAAQMAGVSRSDFARQAYARGMEPPYTERMADEEFSSAALCAPSAPLR